MNKDLNFKQKKVYRKKVLFWHFTPMLDCYPIKFWFYIIQFIHTTCPLLYSQTNISILIRYWSVGTWIPSVEAFFFIFVILLGICTNWHFLFSLVRFVSFGRMVLSFTWKMMLWISFISIWNELDVIGFNATEGIVWSFYRRAA